MQRAIPVCACASGSDGDIKIILAAFSIPRRKRQGIYLASEAILLQREYACHLQSCAAVIAYP